LPLVYRGEAIGLLEASDARRARSYSRQELRLCQAVAGQAAVALHNTSLCAASRSGRDDLKRLCEALRAVAPALAAALAKTDEGALLERLAQAACDVLGAVSCVASTPRRSAGAARLSEPADECREGHVAVGRDEHAAVTITATLRQAPSDGVTELLDVLATVVAARVREPAVPAPTPV
jgi:hypothetical protein